MILSKEPEVHLNIIAQQLKCSDILPIDLTPQRYIGQEITGAGNSIFLSSNSYIAEMPHYEEEIDRLGIAYAQRPLSPFSNLPVTTDSGHHQAPPHHVHLFQRIVGTLGWIAVNHPAVSVRHGELSTYQKNPSSTVFRIAKWVLKELRRDALHPLEYTAVERPEIRLWVDAAVNGTTGRRGWVIQIADVGWSTLNRRNIVAWRSVKDRMKHNSSTSAETNALQQALIDIEDEMYLIGKLFPDAK